MIPGALRNPETLRSLAQEISLVQLRRPVRLMEVCGGHTAVIHRFALNSILPPEIELLSGPGCPVCVTPNHFVDRSVALATVPQVIITTYGDLVRVPGSRGSLADSRARGGDVRVIYSATDALALAEQNPQHTVVLLGIGFETTACTVAASIEQAATAGLRNFRLLSALKTMPAALRVLLADDDVEIDGLILPGHVMTVTGSTPFEFIARDFHIPCVVTGFEPQDMLEAVLMLVRQIASDETRLENQYRRSVTRPGNTHAQEAMSRVFQAADAEWRGLGVISGSGLTLRPEFNALDASPLVPDVPPAPEDRACRCGEVLRGKLKPTECPLFGRHCTPDMPRGACMVSSEGACAAVFQYAAVEDGA